MPLPAAKLREDLVEQLHRANAHLHETKQEWEKMLDASEYRHQARVDAAQHALQSAEQEVEAIEKKIAEAYSMETKRT